MPRQRQGLRQGLFVAPGDVLGPVDQGVVGRDALVRADGPGRGPAQQVGPHVRDGYVPAGGQRGLEDTDRSGGVGQDDGLRVGGRTVQHAHVPAAGQRVDAVERVVRVAEERLLLLQDRVPGLGVELLQLKTHEIAELAERGQRVGVAEQQVLDRTPAHDDRLVRGVTLERAVAGRTARLQRLLADVAGRHVVAREQAGLVQQDRVGRVHDRDRSVLTGEDDTQPLGHGRQQDPVRRTVEGVVGGAGRAGQRAGRKRECHAVSTSATGGGFPVGRGGTPHTQLGHHIRSRHSAVVISSAVHTG